MSAPEPTGSAAIGAAYGQRAMTLPTWHGGHHGTLTTSRRRTGSEVHLTGIDVEGGVIVRAANTTVCNRRSGSDIAFVAGRPTCERCLRLALGA